MEKPEAMTAQKLENELILLAITPAGEVIYDHSNIGVSGVRSTVSALLLNKEQAGGDPGGPEGHDRSSGEGHGRSQAGWREVDQHRDGGGAIMAWGPCRTETGEYWPPVWARCSWLCCCCWSR